MSIHSHLPYDPSTSHARIPAGGINLIASIDSASEAQVTASFFGSTKALHGEVATTSPATTTHNHSNQQYSITAITTSAGAVAERYAYSAYGEPTILDSSGSVHQTSNFNIRHSFTGREWDATVGLHHFRARWMSPKSGRFLTRDPIGFDGDAYGIYEYCHNKPIIYMDPFGKQIMPPSIGAGYPIYMPAPHVPHPTSPTGPVASGRCRITVRCTPLILIGATHCGIRMEGANGSSEIDIGGGDGKCTFVHGPVGLGPIPTNYSDWFGGEYDSSVCDCINRTKAAFDSQNMTYSPIPANGCSDNNPGCNSNYGTKCLLSNCGVARQSTGFSVTDPVGWNFRRKVCVDRYWSTRGRSGCGPCVCRKWDTIDEDYCGEKPVQTPHTRW